MTPDQKVIERFRDRFAIGKGRRWILTEEESDEVEQHLLTEIARARREAFMEVKEYVNATRKRATLASPTLLLALKRVATFCTSHIDGNTTGSRGGAGGNGYREISQHGGGSGN